jgi:hypothetical protein
MRWFSMRTLCPSWLWIFAFIRVYLRSSAANLVSGFFPMPTAVIDGITTRYEVVGAPHRGYSRFSIERALR